MNLNAADIKGGVRVLRGQGNEEEMEMAFVNEYIPEADYEKYDLRRVCEEHNEPNRGHMFSRSWTIDRDRNAFLIKVWVHRDSEYSGYAFYWMGEWMFFEMRLTGVDENRPDGSCWVSYLIKNFAISQPFQEERDQIVANLTQALSVYCGAGVFSTCVRCTATVEFIGV